MPTVVIEDVCLEGQMRGQLMLRMLDAASHPHLVVVCRRAAYSAAAAAACWPRGTREVVGSAKTFW